MKRFTILATAFLALVLSAPAPPPVHAQSITPFPWKSLLPATAALTTDDTDVAFLIKHVGTSASGTAQVSSGDLLLKVGAQGSEAADTTVTGCGGTAGTLDVDNAACDTLGELVDKINASANWRAVILDGLRTDVTASATLVTMAATAATAEDGLGVKWDTSVNFEASAAINAPRKIGPYLSPGGGGTSPPLVPNVFQGRQTIVYHVNATSTYASGTSTVKVISVTPKNGTVGSESNVTTVFTLAGGATATNKVIIDALNQSGVGVLCYPDAKCLVRIDNSAAASVVTLIAYGVAFKY
jgi:hypothetical protein